MRIYRDFAVLLNRENVALCCRRRVKFSVLLNIDGDVEMVAAALCERSSKAN